LSKRKSVRFGTRFIVLSAVGVALAGYTLHARRSLEAQAADAREWQPQISNSVVKTDRLAAIVPVSLTAAQPDNEARYALAAVPPASDVAQPAPAIEAMAPAVPAMDAEKETPHATAPSAPKHAALPPPPPAPHAKPKPAASGEILDDGQIAGLKGRLRLTEDQVGYWPAVEEALRTVRTQLRGHHALRGGKPVIDVNSPEVQKLIWAAVPLLMRLREDQKSEVRKLARIIGLEQVASQI